MLSRGLRSVMLAVFSVAIILPGLQMLWPLFPTLQLTGVEQAVEMPRPSLSAIWKGSWQAELDKWFVANLGFRGLFVKTDNQINCSLFRELPQSMGTRIIIGKNNYLFEWNYISAYNATNYPSDESLDAFVSKVAELQTRLLDRGIQFLLVISPSKAAMYPENLPERYVRPDVDRSRGAYSRVVPLLEKGGISFFDAPSYLRKGGRRAQYPVFPRCGTHWSSYAAATVGREISARLQRMMERRLGMLRLKPPVYEQVPRVPDEDLAGLANVWFPQAFYERMPYPPKPRPRDRRQYSGRYRPSILIEGTSFAYLLVHYFDLYRWYRDRDLFYYFSSAHSYPENVLWKIDREKLDWEKHVFSRDAILIEINEVVILDAGSGFIEAALEQLQEPIQANRTP